MHMDTVSCLRGYLVGSCMGFQVFLVFLATSVALNHAKTEILEKTLFQDLFVLNWVKKISPFSLSAK